MLLSDNNKTARVAWIMSNRCNYNCSYCGFPVKNRKGEGGIKYNSFDYYPVERWLEAFKLFPQTSLYVKLTGGEPFFDGKNLIASVNGLHEMNNVSFIRIDTNGFWNPARFADMEKDKVMLLMSYHPMQIETNKFLENVLKIRQAGFKIPAINFVLAPENYRQFEQYYHLFKQHGLLLAAVPMLSAGVYAGRNERDPEEIELIKKYVPPIDVKYKIDPPTTKGRQCLYPVFSYLINFNGQITCECVEKWQNIFEHGLPELPDAPVACPREYCFGCREMYRELLDEPLARPGMGFYYTTTLEEELRSFLRFDEQTCGAP